MNVATSPLVASLQLLLVIADDWSSTRGELRRFERPDAAQPWSPVGSPIPVSLGRAGLRWGLGLHPAMAGESKREGDGCSPAGIFTLTELFGDGPAESVLGQPARLPYRRTDSGLICVDDPHSCRYNRLVASADDPDWQSHEAMRRDDGRYALGAVIGHNAECLPGAGSCIFLHVWGGAGIPTAGCTAAAREAVMEICGWLHAEATPRLVQLPRAEYRRLLVPWGLGDANGNSGIGVS